MESPTPQNSTSTVSPSPPFGSCPYDWDAIARAFGSTSTEEKKPSVTISKKNTEDVPKKAPPIMIGKRRGGGRNLPTGVVKKVKPNVEPEGSQESQDSTLTRYLKEVRRYQDHVCTDEPQHRPLVK